MAHWGNELLSAHPHATGAWSVTGVVNWAFVITHAPVGLAVGALARIPGA